MYINKVYFLSKSKSCILIYVYFKEGEASLQETWIGLCKKRNIIYNIITCNPEPQANKEVWLFSSNWVYWLFQRTGSNIGSFPVRVTVMHLEASVDWVTCRSVLLEPQTVSDDSVRFDELVQRLKEWFIHEPNSTPNRLSEALDYR